MLSGHTIGLHERSDSNELLLADPVSENDDEEAELSGKVLYRASFEELARSHMQCDTIIWVLISLLLVLAWGVGVVMLLYLPVRRYVLRKDISSRRLYVTPKEIVYKVTRPSFLPFVGFTKIERHIPLHLVIDIIIEQGCLQSAHGIHTFRIESISYGKATPVDELLVQGVFNPRCLRKVIVTEAARSIHEVGSLKNSLHSRDGACTHSRSLTEVECACTHIVECACTHSTSRFQSPNVQVMASPRRAFFEAGGAIPNDLLLHKLEEVEQSVKKIESLVGGSRAVPDND